MIQISIFLPEHILEKIDILVLNKKIEQRKAAKVSLTEEQKHEGYRLAKLEGADVANEYYKTLHLPKLRISRMGIIAELLTIALEVPSSSPKSKALTSKKSKKPN